jgi:hypothetical protein
MKIDSPKNKLRENEKKVVVLEIFLLNEVLEICWVVPISKLKLNILTRANPRFIYIKNNNKLKVMLF